MKNLKLLRKEFILYLVVLAAAVLYFALAGGGTALVILAAVILYGVFALAVTLAEGRKLSVRLPAAQERGKEGGEPVGIILKNDSRIPVLLCDVTLRAENRLTDAAAEEKIRTGLLPRQEKRVEADLSERCCGMIALEAAEVYVTDPIRIFARKIDLHERPAEILILPGLHKEEIDPETLWRYDMESFRFAEGKTGADTSETVGIRDYVPGDNIRSIHWKLSAKTGTVQIKEPGLPVDNRLMLLADKKVPAGGISPEKIDAETTRFLSISWSLLEKELPHTVGWYDARRQEYVSEPVTEPDDLYRVMPDLLSAPWREDSLDAGERFVEAETEKNFASYLIVTPSEENCEAGAGRMRAYGNVTVLTPEIEQA